MRELFSGGPSQEADEVLGKLREIPKEGPSAGITIVTGIVSALTGRPVRNEIAMTGEITIMGKVLGIGGVLPKLQAAIDAGCKEVIMPKENERDVEMTPDYVRTKINVRFVTTIEEVLESRLGHQVNVRERSALQSHPPIDFTTVQGGFAGSAFVFCPLVQLFIGRKRTGEQSHAPGPAGDAAHGRDSWPLKADSCIRF